MILIVEFKEKNVIERGNGCITLEIADDGTAAPEVLELTVREHVLGVTGKIKGDGAIVRVGPNGGIKLA